MVRVETTGKTVEDALRLALIRLGATEDEVTYEILEEGSKGFLGLRAKEYKIAVQKKENPASAAEQFVSEILTNMGIKFSLDVSEVEDELRVDITGEDVGLIIGKHGSTLDSIQYLTNLVVNKKFDRLIRVRIDIGGYREKRLEVLENMASRLAVRVRKSKKAIALEPMNAYERRVIHTFLQKESGIGTKSEGFDPDRYVVIYPERGYHKKKNQRDRSE